jgi:hypothetical protein
MMTVDLLLREIFVTTQSAPRASDVVERSGDDRRAPCDLHAGYSNARERPPATFCFSGYVINAQTRKAQLTSLS